MSQDVTGKQSPEVAELQALADDYDVRKEAYGRASALLRRFAEQLGGLELLIEESQQYDVDDLPETLRQKMRSLVDRTIPVVATDTGTKAKRPRATAQPESDTSKKDAAQDKGQAPKSNLYSPQPIARRKLVQIFVDQGAPKESLQSVGQAAANGIRGTVYGLYHYRKGTPYKDKQPSEAVETLARQLGLAKGGGDDEQWSSLVRDLLEQGVISIEDSQRLHGQESIEGSAS